MEVQMGRAMKERSSRQKNGVGRWKHTETNTLDAGLEFLEVIITTVGSRVAGAMSAEERGWLGPWF